jgi:hypothetical protein
MGCVPNQCIYPVLIKFFYVNEAGSGRLKGETSRALTHKMRVPSHYSALLSTANFIIIINATAITRETSYPFSLPFYPLNDFIHRSLSWNSLMSIETSQCASTKSDFIRQYIIHLCRRAIPFFPSLVENGNEFDPIHFSLFTVLGILPYAYMILLEEMRSRARIYANYPSNTRKNSAMSHHVRSDVTFHNYLCNIYQKIFRDVFKETLS